MKKKKMKPVAVRFPEELLNLIGEYVESSQNKIAPFCRFAVYKVIFDQISGESSHLKMLKDALEKLDLTDEQIYAQKKAIKEVEYRIDRFEPLMHELGYELYGKKEDEEEGDNA